MVAICLENFREKNSCLSYLSCFLAITAQKSLYELYGLLLQLQNISFQSLAIFLFVCMVGLSSWFVCLFSCLFFFAGQTFTGLYFSGNSFFGKLLGFKDRWKDHMLVGNETRFSVEVWVSFFMFFFVKKKPISYGCR